MHEMPAFDCRRGKHSVAREASLSPIFGFSRQGVHFSVLFFLVGIPLARLTGPPPGAASAAPESSRGGCVQSLKRRPYPLGGTALMSLHDGPCHKYTVPLSREYPISTSLILRLHAMLLLPFQPSMLSNT